MCPVWKGSRMIVRVSKWGIRLTRAQGLSFLPFYPFTGAPDGLDMMEASKWHGRISGMNVNLHQSEICDSSQTIGRKDQHLKCFHNLKIRSRTSLIHVSGLLELRSSLSPSCSPASRTSGTGPPGRGAAGRKWASVRPAMMNPSTMTSAHPLCHLLRYHPSSSPLVRDVKSEIGSKRQTEVHKRQRP